MIMRIYKKYKISIKLMIASVMFGIALGTYACAPNQTEQSEAKTAVESEALATAESKDFAITDNEVHVAAGGSDEAGCGTQDAPFATVSHAARTMPGSLIIVHEGVYGPIELGPDCSGSEGSPTVIRAAELETAVFKAAEADSAAVSATTGHTAYDRAAEEEPSEEYEEEDRVCISLVNVCHISLEGLETEGGTHGITYLSTREAGEDPLTDISIRNCTVHGVRGIHGINVYACNDLAPVTDLTIEGCEVYDCECGSSESLVLNGNIDGFLIAGNKIHDNNNIGIDMIGFEGWAMHPDDAAAGPDDAQATRTALPPPARTMPSAAGTITTWIR